MRGAAFHTCCAPNARPSSPLHSSRTCALMEASWAKATACCVACWARSLAFSAASGDIRLDAACWAACRLLFNQSIWSNAVATPTGHGKGLRLAVPGGRTSWRRGTELYVLQWSQWLIESNDACYDTLYRIVRRFQTATPKRRTANPLTPREPPIPGSLQASRASCWPTLWHCMRYTSTARCHCMQSRAPGVRPRTLHRACLLHRMHYTARHPSPSRFCTCAVSIMRCGECWSPFQPVDGSGLWLVEMLRVACFCMRWDCWSTGQRFSMARAPLGLTRKSAAAATSLGACQLDPRSASAGSHPSVVAAAAVLPLLMGSAAAAAAPAAAAFAAATTAAMGAPADCVRCSRCELVFNEFMDVRKGGSDARFNRNWAINTPASAVVQQQRRRQRNASRRLLWLVGGAADPLTIIVCACVILLCLAAAKRGFWRREIGRLRAIRSLLPQCGVSAWFVGRRVLLLRVMLPTCCGIWARALWFGCLSLRTRSLTCFWSGQRQPSPFTNSSGSTKLKGLIVDKGTYDLKRSNIIKQNSTVTNSSKPEKRRLCSAERSTTHRGATKLEPKTPN